jgi:uncharacterized membrane protein
MRHCKAPNFNKIRIEKIKTVSYISVYFKTVEIYAYFAILTLNLFLVSFLVANSIDYRIQRTERKMH